MKSRTLIAALLSIFSLEYAPSNGSPMLSQYPSFELLYIPISFDSQLFPATFEEWLGGMAWRLSCRGRMAVKVIVAMVVVRAPENVER